MLRGKDGGQSILDSAWLILTKNVSTQNIPIFFKLSIALPIIKLLKGVVKNYEQEESDFSKYGTIDAVGLSLLQAKKELIALQIETNGIEFFSPEAVKQKLSEVFAQHIQPEARNQSQPKMADQERREQMLKDYPELNTALERYKDIETLLTKDGSAAYGPTTGVVEQGHER